MWRQFKRRLSPLTTIVFFIFFIIFILFSQKDIFLTKKYWEHLQGVVVSVDDKRECFLFFCKTKYYPMIEFSYEWDTLQQNSLDYVSHYDYYSVGEERGIYYHPKRKTLIIDNTSLSLIWCFLWAMFLSLCRRIWKLYKYGNSPYLKYY